MTERTAKSCVVRRFDVTVSDLPLSCPMKNAPVWCAHPRVYLPIEKKQGESSGGEAGQATCPYCGTMYCLKIPHSRAR